MSQSTKHPLAGKLLKLKNTFIDHIGKAHKYFLVEDLWINISDRGMAPIVSASHGNPAAITFVTRMKDQPYPANDIDSILYGKTGPFGNLIHTDELDLEAGEFERDDKGEIHPKEPTGTGRSAAPAGGAPTLSTPPEPTSVDATVTQKEKTNDSDKDRSKSRRR